MQKMYTVKLNKKEQAYLQKLIRTGNEKARKLTRARILIEASQGKKDTDIATALHSSLTTIARIRQRYNEEGLDVSLNERPRSGAPRKFSGKDRAKITALACSTPPQGQSRWTLRLLADTAVELCLVDEISHFEVWRTLKKTR